MWFFCVRGAALSGWGCPIKDNGFFVVFVFFLFLVFDFRDGGLVEEEEWRTDLLVITSYFTQLQGPVASLSPGPW